MPAPKFAISTAIYKKKGRLYCFEPPLPTHDRDLKKLPQLWQKAATNFTRFKALVKNGTEESIPQLLENDKETFTTWEAMGADIAKLKSEMSEADWQKLEQMPEGIKNAHLILEIDGKFQLLKISELEALDTANLDEKAIVDQLTP